MNIPEVLVSFKVSLARTLPGSFGDFIARNRWKKNGKMRVGRTKGVENRFKEPPRYVGLSGLDDDW